MSEIETIIKDAVSEITGVDPDEIKPSDSLVDDLHMSPADISDFFIKLNDKSIDTSSLNFEIIQTVEDLIDSLDTL
jgi:hypothetical protein